MATLTNTQISVTYVGLLKTSANTVLTSTAQQITDGSGNNSILYLSTAGVGIGGSPASGKELDVTGNVQVTGDLIIDNITIDGSTITNASGDLLIVNTSNDGSVIFQSDDASGGVETYFFLDGGNTSSNPITIFPDNSRLAFGGSQDLEIFHDGSNSRINETGTGNLIIQSTNFQLLKDDGGEFIMQGISDAEVSLYFDGSKKFETTSTGVTVTGTSASNSLLVNGGADAIAKVLGTTSGARLDLQTNSHHRFLQTIESDGRFRFYDQTNGAERFTITSSGLLGLGTTSPESTTLMHISVPQSGSASGTGLTISGWNGSAESRVQLMSFGIGGGTFAIRTGTSNTERLRIDSSGNVGINTTSPNRVLEVSSNASDVPQIRAAYNSTNYLDIKHNTLNAVSSGGNDSIQIQTGGTTGLTIDVSQNATFAGTLKSNTDFVVQVDADNNTSGSVFKILGGGGSELFRVNEAAQVGINETSPDAKLHIKSSDNLLAILESTDSLAYMSFVDSSTTSNTSVAIGADANNLAFYTGTSFGTEKMRLTSSGLLGLGTTSPSATLEVAKGSEGDYLIVGGDNSSNGRALVFSSSTATSNGAKHTIRAQSGNGQIAFKTGTTEALLLDSSQNATFSGNITLNGSHTITNDSNGHLNINSASGKQIFIDAGGQLRLDSGGAQAFTLDSSQDASFTGNVSLADSKKVQLGAGQDLQIYHDGSNSYIQNEVGNLQIFNKDDDKDIIFSSDNGSGGTTEYFRVDGSSTTTIFSKNITVNDNVLLQVGDGNDGAFYHSTDTFLTNSTGDLRIRQFADDKDIIFDCDDGSGGTTEYFKLDGSQTIIDVAVRTLFRDSVKATFGAGYDLVIYHDGSNSYVEQQGTGDLIIRNSTDDKDIIFQSDDGSGGVTEYFRLDGGNTNMVASKTILYSDSVKASFGNSEDLRIQHNGTNSNIENFTGDFQIIQNVDDGDLNFRCDDGSGGTATYFFLDGSESRVTFNKYARFIDSVPLQLGTSGDFDMNHNGTDTSLTNYTGDLYITNQSDDKDIIFRSDDGSGGFNEYFRLDGSTEANVFTKNVAIGSSSADGKLDITQSSATEPVIRLTDDGVCNYDFIFPDSDTIKLETSTSSNKTFKLLNAGSGNMNLEVSGSLSKGSGSFRIDHPVKPDTHYLYHSFVESPLTDLIYRGKTKLKNGKASINIDKHFGMTEGTFVALVDDKQIFTTNEDTWDAVRGKIKGNELHIECQNKEFNGYVSWLVIGDRKDKHIMEVDWTDEKGKPILEIRK